MTIGQPGDKYEQEADQVASQVVQQINSPVSEQSAQGQTVQREEVPFEEEQVQAKSISDTIQRQEAVPEEDELQTKPDITALQRRDSIGGGDASTDVESAINTARGGGQPLDAGLQRSMGEAMGADFSRVKIHTDAQSDQLNRSIQARAFTTGQDVFFRQGEYNPGSNQGQELIAHELTHVVQQKQELTIQRGLLDDFLLCASNIYHDVPEGVGIESHDEAEIARLLAFAQHGDPSTLSDAELKIKINQISNWLTKNPQKNPNKELLKSSLTKLESEVKTRVFLATVKKLPGWGKMSSEDQVILENILKGQNNAVSASVRSTLEGMLKDLASKTDVGQAKALTGLISAKESLPEVVNEPVTTTKIKYTLEGPTTEKDYAFRGKTADGEKWIVKFEDGISIPIVAPKAPEPGYHNHTVQQAADAASYLPKANRSVMTTILLNAVVNPDDAYWVAEYKTPDFHSYMTAGQAGVVTIYPDKVTKGLPDENYMRGTMIHETGHTWSYKTWGTDTNKGKWVDWKDAMAKDKVSVSGYAIASISEDVAETIQVYSSTQGSPRFAEYRQIVPNRFKILDAEYN